MKICLQTIKDDSKKLNMFFVWDHICPFIKYSHVENLFIALKHKKISCLGSIFPFWCKIIDFSSLVQTNTFAASSLENRATPKTIRRAEGCVWRPLKEQGPWGYADSVSPILTSKNKGIPQKIRARPHPKPRLLLLLLPPLSFLQRFKSCTHTQTHIMTKVISCRHQ